MVRIINKIKRHHSQHGTWDTLLKVVQYLLRPVYRKETYMIFSLDLRSFTVPTVRGEKFSFKFIHEHETGYIRQIENMEKWLRNIIAKKIQNGGPCVVALDDEIVAGFLLGNIHEMELPPKNYHRLMKQGECFGEQIRVSENYQRQGLSVLLRSAFLKEMKSRGVKRHYTTVNELNTISISAVGKYGYKYLAHRTYWKIIKCTAIRLKRVPGF